MIYCWLLILADNGDKEYPTDRPVYVVWSIGRLDENNEPSFHEVYSKSDLKLEFGRLEPDNSCVDFTANDQQLR